MSRTGVLLAVVLALACPWPARAQEGDDPVPGAGEPVITAPADPAPQESGASADESQGATDEPPGNVNEPPGATDKPDASPEAPQGNTPAPPWASFPWPGPPPPPPLSMPRRPSLEDLSRPDSSGPGPRCVPSLEPDPAPMGPTFRCDFPDPMVLRIGTTYYAYGTSVKWSGVRHAFPILSSTDLRRWTPVGDAFADAPAWAAGQLWAPSVLHVRGTYYLYYSALRRSDSNHCIAAATSSSPVGPFTDHGPIRCRDSRDKGFIDPAALVYRGRGYLYFSVDGPGHSISALPLDPTFLRARGKPRRLINLGARERRLSVKTVEAPFPVRRGRRFYLFYSAGCWCSDYQTDWAVADSPLGPYRRTSHKPLLAGGAGLSGPGGGSLVTRPDGSTVLAFHAWTGANDYDLEGVRTLRTAPIRWTPAGPTLAP